MIPIWVVYEYDRIEGKVLEGTFYFTSGEAAEIFAGLNREFKSRPIQHWAVDSVDNLPAMKKILLRQRALSKLTDEEKDALDIPRPR